MVGSRHNERFYPDFAGVAKSYNFYPVPPQASTDGIVLSALGLGKTVVDGGNAVRFCPKYPRHLMQFFNTTETLKNAQQDFFALNLEYGLEDDGTISPEKFVEKFDMGVAEKDQTLFYVGSTYSPENDTVYDGISRNGKRVVTFAPILKHGVYPLPEILEMMLRLGTWGMGTQVEIEFAANMDIPPAKPKEFAMLQIRPMVLSRELEELDIDVQRENIICQSSMVLGNGSIKNIHDIVMIDVDRFDRAKSKNVADEVSEMNTKLVVAHRPYILIGVGRWGSLDPWLGIPVTWDQIAGACAIVEAGFKDISVTPSQGSHFFQNITSFRIGYFTVDSLSKVGFIDWDWLRAQPSSQETGMTRHLSFKNPLEVKINGHKNIGIIVKPGNIQ